jgi:hypothetical protein
MIGRARHLTCPDKIRTWARGLGWNQSTEIVVRRIRAGREGRVPTR